MKNYVNTMNQLLNIMHPDSECSCYVDFGMDEDFLCDLCLARLKAQRRKIKKKRRREDMKRFKPNEYIDNATCKS